MSEPLLMSRSSPKERCMFSKLTWRGMEARLTAMS